MTEKTLAAPKIFGREMSPGETGWELDERGHLFEVVRVEEADDSEYHGRCDLNLCSGYIEFGTDMYGTAQEAADALEAIANEAASEVQAMSPGSGEG